MTTDHPADRIDILRAGAEASGLTIDFLEALTRGLSRPALIRIMGNASALPWDMRFSDNPATHRPRKEG